MVLRYREHMEYLEFIGNAPLDYCEFERFANEMKNSKKILFVETGTPIFHNEYFAIMPYSYTENPHLN